MSTLYWASLVIAPPFCIKFFGKLISTVFGLRQTLGDSVSHFLLLYCNHTGIVMTSPMTLPVPRPLPPSRPWTMRQSNHRWEEWSPAPQDGGINGIFAMWYSWIAWAGWCHPYLRLHCHGYPTCRITDGWEMVDPVVEAEITGAEKVEKMVSERGFCHE